ncbi:MAG: substrate-binding domain-containing protein, partial [Anaerolineaceae bacterium]|nr:substrate-binding domain-containing protein [Anaerolineaceae bacterium]
NKWFLVVLVLVLALSACAAPAAEEAAPAAEEAAAEEEAAPAEEEVDLADLTFAICVKSIGANWFGRLEEGIIEYAEETGATTFLCGPSKGDPAAQIGILEEIIAQGVDGIGNVPFGVEEHEPVHKKAMDAGIPVVLHEASFAKNADYDIEAFDNCEYGAEMMDTLAELMGEEGVYVSFVGSLTNDSHMIWQECAYQRQLEAYPNMERLGLYESKEDIEVSYQIFKDLLKTNPEIKGMTGSSAGDVVAIGRAVQEAGLTDDIMVVGTTIVSYAGELIATGDIDMGMAWDPAKAGKAMCVVLGMINQGKEIYDGMDLGVEGYNHVTIAPNEAGLKVITGNAWIKFNADNMNDPAYNF